MIAAAKRARLETEEEEELYEEPQENEGAEEGVAGEGQENDETSPGMGEGRDESQAAEDVLANFNAEARSWGDSDKKDRYSDKNDGPWNYTVTYFNVPEDYTHESLVELHEAANLDISALQSSKFMPMDNGPFCKVILRYRDEKNAKAAADTLDGQEVAGEADIVRTLKCDFSFSRSPVDIKPSVYLSDIPMEYKESDIRNLHKSIGLDEDCVISLKFLASRDPTGETCSCIVRYNDEESANEATAKITGKAVKTCSGKTKWLGARMAKPAKWMVDSGVADKQKEAYDASRRGGGRKRHHHDDTVRRQLNHQDGNEEFARGSKQDGHSKSSPAWSHHWEPPNPNGGSWYCEKCCDFQLGTSCRKCWAPRPVADSKPMPELCRDFCEKHKLEASTYEWLQSLPYEVQRGVFSRFSPKESAKSKEPENDAEDASTEIPEDLADPEEPAGPIVISGLPEDADKDFVESLLSMYGSTKKCELKSGMAFVEMELPDDARMVVDEMNGITPDSTGKPLGVKFVKSIKEDVARGVQKKSQSQKLKTMICRRWQAGECNFNERCTFAHGDVEIGTPQPELGLWGKPKEKKPTTDAAVRQMGLVLYSQHFASGQAGQQQYPRTPPPPPPQFGGFLPPPVPPPGFGGFPPAHLPQEPVDTKGLIPGVVKFWNIEKKFGFVCPDGGGDDIFVHYSALVDGDMLEKESSVFFDAEKEEKTGKYKATKVVGAKRNPHQAVAPPPSGFYPPPPPFYLPPGPMVQPPLCPPLGVVIPPPPGAGTPMHQTAPAPPPPPQEQEHRDYGKQRHYEEQEHRDYGEQRDYEDEPEQEQIDYEEEPEPTHEVQELASRIRAGPPPSKKPSTKPTKSKSKVAAGPQPPSHPPPQHEAVKPTRSVAEKATAVRPTQKIMKPTAKKKSEPIAEATSVHSKPSTSSRRPTALRPRNSPAPKDYGDHDEDENDDTYDEGTWDEPQSGAKRKEEGTRKGAWQWQDKSTKRSRSWRQDDQESGQWQQEDADDNWKEEESTKKRKRPRYRVRSRKKGSEDEEEW